MVSEPNGTPARQACLAIATAQEKVKLENGKISRYGRTSPDIETDDQGKYRLPILVGDFKMMVVSDQGFAVVSSDELKDEGDIILQPWGRLEGMLFAGNRPLAGSSVSLEVDPGDPEVWDRDINWHYTTTTDENGCFAFEQVRPGQVRVSRLIPTIHTATYSSSQYAMNTETEVQAHQNAYVEIGGGGRRVMGQFICPDGWDVEILSNSVYWVEKGFSSGDKDLWDCPPLVVPQELFLMTYAERMTWFGLWSLTPVGKGLMEYFQSPSALHFGGHRHALCRADQTGSEF